MGIRFTDSILALLAALAFVLVAYFAGHALSSEHAAWAWATAAGLAVFSAVTGFIAVRRVRGYARDKKEVHS
jgi:uncharacterized membrane protein